MEEQNEDRLAEDRERMRKVLEHVLSQLDDTTHLMVMAMRGGPENPILSQHIVGLDHTGVAYLCTHAMAAEFGITERGEKVDLGGE